MGRGQLIVLEGVDGAGTSTQTALLGEALRTRDLPVHLTREPSDGPIGVLIRQILTRRLVVQGRNGPRFPRMETMALLFAADRVDHLESEVLLNLGDGITVVCDRYVHSSIAYQSLTASPGDDAAEEWIERINSRARRADLVIVLDVSASVAAARRGRRGGPDEMYEDDSLQSRLRDFYLTLPERCPAEHVVVVDGERDVSTVHQSVLDVVLRHLESARP
jgi:dTMP kinase